MSELYDGPFDMPARLLGHLAVDERFQHRGIGEYLVKYIILHSHDDTIKFYQRYGFTNAVPREDENARPILMFYDLGRLQTDH